MHLINAIDKLGAVKAQIANLERLEKALIEEVKHELLDAGTPAGEGEFFRATLVTAERVTVDAKAVTAKFPRADFPSLYRSAYTETLRITARTGEEIAA